MSTLLTDDDLTRLLGEAAGTFDVPDHTGVTAAATGGPVPVPLLRRRWVQVSAVAAVTVGALVLAGGTGGGGHGSVTASTGGPARAIAPADVAAGLAHDTSGAATGRLVKAPVTAPQPPVAGGPVEALTGGGVGGGVAAPPAADGARVVKTGELSLVVKNGRVSGTLTAVGRAAKAAGGYTSTSETQEYGSTPSGTVTVRVPVAAFENVVAQIRSFDAQVRTANVSGRDVTAEYTDVQAQLATLTAARSRFLELLSKATTIGDILTVQQRVDDTTSQINRLEGQRRVLASQSDLATLAVTVTQADDPVVLPAARHRSGLDQAFQDAKDGFVTGVEGLIRRSGRALLVLLCLAGLVLAGRGAWRVVRRGML